MTEPELLDAIWQNPDDDAPRLVYADWLQERGDPRGEYIHITCNPSRTDAQTERSSSLLMQHMDAWLKPFYRLGAKSVMFERGLPISFSIDSKDLALNGGALLRMAPFNQVGVKAPYSAHSLAPFFALPEFARLERFGFYDCVGGDDSVRELTQAAHLGPLTRLDFWRTSLTAEGVTALAAWPGLRSVRQLSITECRIDAECAALLARSPMLSGLQELSLLYNSFGVRGAKALAESTTLSSLVSLDVRNCELGFEGVSAFVDGRGLPALRELKISANIGDETPERAKARFAYDKPHLIVS